MVRPTTGRATASGARIGLVALCGALVGCQGGLSGDGSRPGAGPFGPSGGAAGVGGASTLGQSALDSPGPMPIRRLNKDELNNTLRDLLEDDSQAAAGLPAESRGLSGFIEAGQVSVVDAEGLLAMSERVGSRLAAKLPGLLGCGAGGADEQACARSFFTSFGRRAYRRPLNPSELNELVDYVAAVKVDLGYSFENAVRTAIQAMLQSPAFLYHWELGAEPARVQAGVVPLTAHESAARLSYFLWGSMPDAALFAAVDTGRLASAADVAREGRRMLAEPKARSTIARFHSQWLKLEKLADLQKDPVLYPAFSPALAGNMAESSAEFVTRTILDGDGTLASLLTSTTYYVNAEVAKLYGVTAGAQTGLMPVSVPGNQRAGLFTQAAFLSVHATATDSHPIKRGHKLYQDVLCGSVPPPPAAIPPAGEPTESLSTRETFSLHGQAACAVGCHARFDGLGFAFEHYDGLGQYQTTDGGKPVDASGTLVAPSGTDSWSFANAVELSSVLASSEDVRRCIGKQWFRFALGRMDLPGDGASLASAHEAFAASDHNLRELILGVAVSRSFLNRSPAEGEVLK